LGDGRKRISSTNASRRPTYPFEAPGGDIYCGNLPTRTQVSGLYSINLNGPVPVKSFSGSGAVATRFGMICGEPFGNASRLRSGE
jgi:hypothetical protein